MNLQGKVAIVTGAASGIGHGIAKRYVAAGARVAIADLKAEAAEAAATELTKAGPGEAIGIVMDVTSRGDNGIMFEGTEGRIFINRGRLSGKPVEDLETNPLPEGAVEAVYNGREVTDHFRNFFESLAEGVQPISDVFSHHRALSTCHLAGIAARLNSTIQWDPEAERVTNNKLAHSLISRDKRKGFEIEQG